MAKANGKVGIGKVDPAAGLEVNSNDSFFGVGVMGIGTYLDIGSLGDPTAVWIDARSSDLADVGMNLRTKGTGNFVFHNGKVGIGTTSPTTKLHVAGKVKIDTITSGSSSTTVLVSNGGVIESVDASINVKSWCWF